MIPTIYSVRPRVAEGFKYTITGSQGGAANGINEYLSFSTRDLLLTPR